MNDSYSLLSPLKTFSVKEISCSTKLYQRFRYTLGYAEVAYPDPDEMSPVRNSLGQKLNSSKKKITATDHNTTIESDVATLYKVHSILLVVYICLICFGCRPPFGDLFTKSRVPIH
jgi:hypothetical protein